MNVSGKFINYNNHIIIRLLIVVGFLVNLSLVCNAWYWSDDYVFMMRIEKLGVFGHLVDGYLTLDGRFLSLQGLLQASLIGFFSPLAIIAIWNLLFGVFSFSILSFITFEFNIKRYILGYSVINRILLFIVIYYALWFSFAYILSDILYWATGGVYIVNLVIYSLFLFFFSKLLKSQTPSGLVFLIILGVNGGLIGINGAFSLLCFLFIEFSLHFQMVRKNNYLKSIFVGGFFSVIAGMLLNLFSPGNYSRASIHESSFDLSIIELIKVFPEILARYSYYSLFAFLMAGFFIYYVFGAHVFIDKKKLSFKEIISFLFPKNALMFLFKYKYFFVGIASIIPILFVPEFSGRRTAIFFVLCVFLGSFYIIYSFFLHYNFLDLERINKFNTLARRGVLIVVFSLFILIFVHNFCFGRIIKYQMLDRDKFLIENSKNVNIIGVEPIIVDKVPFAVKFHDNLHLPYANYYGFEIIYLDSSKVEKLPYYYITPP